MSGFGVLLRADQAHLSSPLRQTYASPRSRTTTNTVISIEPEPAQRLDVDGPREDEHGLDVEDHEEQGVDVVADVHLAEQRQRVGARLVGDVLLVLRAASGAGAGRSPSIAPTMPNAATTKTATARYCL